jgi:hypothetical protein
MNKESEDDDIEKINKEIDVQNEDDQFEMRSSELRKST